MYVCRYAYSVYSMCDRPITFGDARGASGLVPFQQAITDSKAFKFDGNDILRIRTELRTLISRLSTMYKAWKEASPAPAKHSACRWLLEDFHTTDNADDAKSVKAKGENPIWDHIRELERFFVDRRPPTGGRSEGAVPGSVIEGRLCMSPSTQSAFQGGDGSVTHSSANDANENPIWDHIRE